MSNLNFKTKVREGTGKKLPRLSYQAIMSKLRPAAALMAKKVVVERIIKPLEGQMAYIPGRSPLNCFYYGKHARGRWIPVYRILEGMKHNYWRRHNLCTPMTKPEMPPKVPPIVSGIMFAMHATKEKLLELAELVPQHVKAKHSSSSFTMHVHHHRSMLQDVIGATGFQLAQLGWFSQFPRHTGAEPPRKEQHIEKGHIALDVRPEQPKAEVIQISSHRDYRPVFGAYIPVETMPERKENVVQLSFEAANDNSSPKVRPETANEQKPVSAEAAPQRGERLADVWVMPLKGPKAAPANGNAAKMASGIAPMPREKAGAVIAGQLIRIFRPKSIPQEFSAFAPSPEKFERTPDPEIEKHIGYIPSIRKKILQLKVAQGAEGIPPQ